MNARGRRTSRGIVLGIVGAIALSTVPAGPATALSLDPVRKIGGKGHAGLYGWGVAVETAAAGGFVIVSDYWNYNADAFNTNGTPRSFGLKGSTHAAPYSVAVDPRNGDFYVGDVDSNATVDKYDQSGNFIRSFGTKGSGSQGQMIYPAWLAVRSDGQVFVSDSRSDNITVWNADGSFVREWGSSGGNPGQFHTPRGLAFGANDTLYVIDASNKRVQVFDASGSGVPTFLRQWKVGQSGEEGAFHGDLRGIAVDPANGWVYVVDAVSQYVNKYTTAGTYLLRFGGFGTAPGKFVDGGRGVAVDHDGNVWVGNMPNFGVDKFSPQGASLGRFPDPAEPPPDGGFAAPTDVALDASGAIFVTDVHNWQIDKFAASGTWVKAWGVRGNGPYAYNYPKAIDVDRRDGSVIVGDTDNGSLKKYTNDGTWLWTSQGNAGVKSTGIDVGPDGTIYATDFKHGVIEVLGADGGFIRQMGSGRFNQPRGVAYDPDDGSLWAADRARGKLLHFSNAGTFLAEYGSLGTDASQFSQAEGVAVDGTHVYVADAGTCQIKVWTKAGSFVGAFGSCGTALGQMRGPHGLEIGPDGDLYVVEQPGERVQEFDITP